MKRIAITIGIGSDWQGHALAVDVAEKALQVSRDYLTKQFSGYTEELVHGGWRKGDAKVEEPGRRFIIVADLNEADAEALARLLGRLFNQRAVMLEVEQLVDGSGVINVW